MRGKGERQMGCPCPLARRTLWEREDRQEMPQPSWSLPPNRLGSSSSGSFSTHLVFTHSQHQPAIARAAQWQALERGCDCCTCAQCPSLPKTAARAKQLLDCAGEWRRVQTRCYAGVHAKVSPTSRSSVAAAVAAVVAAAVLACKLQCGCFQWRKLSRQLIDKGSTSTPAHTRQRVEQQRIALCTKCKAAVQISPC